MRLHCLKRQNVVVLFADFLGVCLSVNDLWYELHPGSCSGADHNYSLSISAASFLSSTHFHTVNFSKEYFVCVDHAVCRPGSSGWCIDLVNSFQKDIQSEQAIAKNRE